MYKLGSFEYPLTEPNHVVRISDGACIPFDEGNRHYQEYLEWLAEGNLPEIIEEVVES